MSRYELLVLLFLALGLFALADCAPEPAATSSRAEIPPVASGTARVWFLRASDSPRGSVQAAEPVVFANGSPIGDLRVNSKFFRDFAPGTYSFTVQSYGLPTAQAATVQLSAGMQAYLQVQWAASWQFGFPGAGWSFAPNTFVVFPISPEVAQAYLPTLTYTGQR